MGMELEDAEDRVIDSGKAPIIHADETAYMKIVGDRLWVTFIEKQPGPNGTLTMQSGQLSFKLDGVLPAIWMALDQLATAGILWSLKNPTARGH